MARRKSNSGKRKRTEKVKKSSSRAIWKGSINFGLVNIPVGLYTAESSNDLDFDLLDRRDFSPVRYRRVNEKTGREVPWDQIVKGYQHEKGEYVALSSKNLLMPTSKPRSRSISWTSWTLQKSALSISINHTTCNPRNLGDAPMHSSARS